MRDDRGQSHNMFVAVLLTILSSAANAQELRENECAVWAVLGDPRIDDLSFNSPNWQLIVAPDLRILERPADEPVKILAAPGVNVRAVVCHRSEAKLGSTDYLVSEAGYPLFVTTAAFDQPSMGRMIVLEQIDGDYRVRLLQGAALSRTETEQLNAATAAYKSARSKAGTAGEHHE